ncbi:MULTISPECIES: DUF1700 domain-containing protein [unclassified Paludibacterium]|uniref:DUF1700 domain-containing protein n=1 Tax=unclassified Paludibacterium TaxID=2618429 RepID=UPI001C055298|nr:DUF1700 domain-containing protein [Paludibacterium sp. B53371]BEV71928.1 hypothetical protein THUN1379_14100 [Paludibacterium sp. THUN1379]
MKRDDFLERLARALHGLPPAEREEILADYRSYFADALADGRQEEEVARALGEPERLARELTAERHLKQWEAHKTPANLGRVLSALAGLSVLNLLLAMPYLVVMTVLGSLWLGALMMLLGGFLMAGSWATHALIGWPQLGYGHAMRQFTLYGHQEGRESSVQIHTDASSGAMQILVQDDHSSVSIRNASDGSLKQLAIQDPDGQVVINGMMGMPRAGMLVTGLVMMLIGGLGSVLGWKVISALWRGTGLWLRWQWRLLHEESRP